MLLAACGTASIGGVPESRTLSIVSGSENRTLEPIIQQWASENNYAINIDYSGSVDIARMLRSGAIAYDGVWPANSLWIAYGDTNNLVSSDTSIMRSPVVFAIKRSTAQRLGWIDAEVSMADILEAAESGDVRFMMTSATQSNSGASFYFAALSAFAGSPEVISMDDLEDPTVQDEITRILGTVDRSSGSSGWLKDLFLNTYDLYDGMVNYEAVVIEANLELEQQGRETLYAIYPTDGSAIADSPLGFVERDPEKEVIFDELQAFLLSEEAQSQLLAAGRRTGVVGMQVENADTSVFRPEWGIDVDSTIQSIRFPNSNVIGEALDLYQTTFRRPSCTAIAVDRSGSMEGNGERNANEGLRTLLNQSIAADFLLQGHPEDITTVILFNGSVINRDFTNYTVEGNDPGELNNLFQLAERIDSGGNTNIFGTVEEAHKWIEQVRTSECLPSVILMTDGRDNEGSWTRLQNYLQTTENDIPVFVITFGDADDSQIDPIVDFTFGRAFDGRNDLVAAFRSAKGYN
ncbi:MAG: VWA domain-containing protein [Chloroflexota bacterium]